MYYSSFLDIIKSLRSEKPIITPQKLLRKSLNIVIDDSKIEEALKSKRFRRKIINKSVSPGRTRKSRKATNVNNEDLHPHISDSLNLQVIKNVSRNLESVVENNQDTWDELIQKNTTIDWLDSRNNRLSKNAKLIKRSVDSIKNRHLSRSLQRNLKRKSINNQFEKVNKILLNSSNPKDYDLSPVNTGRK